MIRAALLAALLIAPAAPTLAQPGDILAGSAQRRPILDAVRPPIEQALRGPVEFVVQMMRIEGDWAVVIADPQRPGGGAIDGRLYFPAEVERDGLTVTALLRLTDGRWVLHDHAIGATDVWLCGVEGPPRTLTGC